MTEKRGLVAMKLAEERRRLVRAVEPAGDGEVDDRDEPAATRDEPPGQLVDLRVRGDDEDVCGHHVGHGHVADRPVVDSADKVYTIDVRRAAEGTALIVSFHRGHLGRKLTTAGLRGIVNGYFGRLGLPPDMWGAHTLRRTAGTPVRGCADDVTAQGRDTSR